MIIESNDQSHLVLLPKLISKEQFLKHAKVRKDSYFYKRLESIYISLTASTVNLEEEFKTYYSEYENIESFLFYKYPYLEKETIKLILTSLNTNKYKLLRGHMYELSDYQLHMLMDYSEDFVKKINKLLKAELYEN